MYPRDNMKTLLFASLMTVLACGKKPAESTVEAAKEITTETAPAEAATEEAATEEVATEEAAPAVEE